MKRFVTKVLSVLCACMIMSTGIAYAETPTTLDAYERLGLDAEGVVEVLDGMANDDWKNVIARNTNDVNMNLLLATFHMTDGDAWSTVTIDGIRSALYDSELPLLPKEEVDSMSNAECISRYLDLMIEYIANMDYYSE